MKWILLLVLSMILIVPAMAVNPPGIPAATTTGAVGALDIVNSSRNFNISVNQSANVSWQVNGVEKQYNASILPGNYANYTNQSGRAGTWTVSAVVNNSNGTTYQNWTWTVSESTISGAVVETNFTNINSSRMNAGVNTSLSFYLNDSNDIRYVNITTGDFTFGGIVLANISTSESFGVVTLATSGNTIVIKNSTGQGANHTGVWVNLTANVKPPAAGFGVYPINIATDRNPTGTNVTVYVRDTTKPFFVKANNSVFTVTDETIAANKTTLTLSGTGSSNLTFYAVNITGQTNITVGYNATNATKIKSRYDSTLKLVVIYVETNPSVQNPIVVVTNAGELTSSNLPAAIIAGGAIGGAIIVYIFRRRRH
jgi:hypothetical protein